jgi:hypothetical protein
MVMLTEHESHAAMFLHDHGPLFLFPHNGFLYLFFLFSGTFRYSHEQQKLEVIDGGIGTYGHAVGITVEDESTLCPLICRWTWGEGDFTMGLPNSTDLSHL